MKLLFLFIILIIVVLLLEKLLNKLFSVEKKSLSETPGKRIDQWGRGVITVISLCILPFVLGEDTNITKWFFTIFVIVIFGFQFILEWRYLRSTNKHIVTFAFLLVSVILMYNMEYLLKIF